MSRPVKLARPVQLNLFREPATTPTWHQMPAEVRCKTRDLLARLFRAHRLARPGVARDEEGSDD